MARLDDLEARVTALEEQGHQYRRDAAAARILAGAADRDVSDFKQTLNGHTQVLNALRETQVEHGQRLDTLEAKVDSGFTKVNISMEQISGLLQRLIDKG
ncbi:hypothetical protein MUY14_26925 [Amycolatopsis sp. FBCC-B4732]|uniref:hypothetical protein n=1 Tax=Amycolatopsis sp. FBCC-B4732 TaxID=3079339 RepID=UPI001FF2F17C|nr:hypothetical protein [Amycolatopsis sp. FBCC-B4732]UOX85415.1 hypothetical protein MUY14_26925 [Amycolatopsis sp. FBCC-B4732]